jgi:hypothetical protein
VPWHYWLNDAGARAVSGTASDGDHDEAFGYEVAIATAVLTVASSVATNAGLSGSVLDVGSGGSRLVLLGVSSSGV